MSDDEAYQKFLEILGYDFSGPWVFTAQIP
jgi:hypothetical protein